MSRAALAVVLLPSFGCWGLVGDGSSRSDVPPVQSAADEPGTPEPDAPDSPFDRERLERALREELPASTFTVQSILAAAQGLCGSSALLGVPGPVGVDGLADLIESGELIPGDAAASPLMQRLMRGETAEGTPACTAGDLALLGRFIDELVLADPAPCDAAPFMSFEALHAAMLADVVGEDPADRRFFRYFSVAYLSNAGLCGRELERERLALSEAVNSLSIAPDIRRPRAIDPGALLYRIDLRDYGWNRSIDLWDDGQHIVADGWLAIVDALDELAVEFTGDAPEALKLETGTPVPWLPVNAFVWYATQGDLYYALIDNDANLFDTQQRLGVESTLAPRPGCSIARASWNPLVCSS